MKCKKNPGFLFIGNGRLFKHLSHYFSLLGIPFRQWSRDRHKNEDLAYLLEGIHTVLLAIPDQALADWVEKSRQMKGLRCVHFSGATSLPFAYSAHPLCSFGEPLYDLEFYKSISFVCEQNRDLAFKDLFPDLENPHFEIPSEAKAFYHALCVVSGNYTSLLWQNVESSFKKDLGIPPEALKPYMRSIFENFLFDSSKALTGPLVRGDKDSIDKNLRSLQQHKLESSYQSMLELFDKEQKMKGLHL